MQLQVVIGPRDVPYGKIVALLKRCGETRAEQWNIGIYYASTILPSLHVA